MDTKQLYSLLYGECIEKILNTYTNTGDYVFIRKKHDINQYYSYLKANNSLATCIALTTPAFPKYLLPPTNIISELEKSPKLLLQTEGFREENWKEIIGEFYCKIEDIEKEINPKKKNKLDSKGKLINYLINKNNNKQDEYIYSIYTIIINKEKSNEIKYHCLHLYDITQKSIGNYSLKKDSYTQQIQSYYVSLNLENSEIISSY